MKPEVSIIIPAYNRAAFIRETLESVQNQTFGNWECVVIDDGSTDETPNIIREFEHKDSRFRFYARPETLTKGANNCRNFGFGLSRGTFVNWFDSDDIMLPEFISVRMRHMTSDLQMVICSGFYVDEDLSSPKPIPMRLKGTLFSDYVMWKLQVLTPSVLFRKSFLEDKELFSASISRGQEKELFSRLFFGLPDSAFEILDEPLFLYRQHPDSKTHRNKEYVNGYKESLLHIVSQNLERSLEIGDMALVKYHYDALVDLYFRGLENRHAGNVRASARLIYQVLETYDKKAALEFRMLRLIFTLSKRGSYSLERRIKNFIPKID